MAVDPLSVIRIIEAVSAAGSLLAGAEALYRMRSSQPALTHWDVMQTRHPLLATGRWATTFHALANDRHLAALHALRIVAATSLLVLPLPDAARGICDAVIALTFLASAIRCPYGLDGADQMFFLCLVACALSRAGGPVSQHAALIFIAGQATLSYFIAGIAKLISTDWRSGSALPGVLATKIYGYLPLARWLHRHPLLAKAACGGVTAWEVSFPLMFVAPPPVALAMLIMGAAFHVSCALIMHLNTFAWAFIAAYPAIWYVYRLIGT